MEVKKVAILGAGNGGLTAAADLAERGFDISLYTWPTREYQFEGLINRGGLLLQEPNAEPPKEVFVPITNYTIDMAEAIKDAQVIMLTVPGYAGLRGGAGAFGERGSGDLLQCGCGDELCAF